MAARLIIAAAAFLLLLLVMWRWPRHGAVACLAYLALVGGARRWLIPSIGYTGNDPLLLVVPAVVLATVAIVRAIGVGDPQARLSKLALWLLGFMLIQACNPLQGGVAVGAAGILFYVIPVLWFFIGRWCGTPQTVTLFLRTIVVIGVAAAAYGLYQTWFGFTEGELAWLAQLKSRGTYEALNVGVVRAFSFFTSASEYACFVAITVVILFAAVLKGSWKALVPLPLLGLALFLESSRGIIVLTLFACAVLWAVQSRTLRTWIIRGGVALFVALSGLGWSLGHLQERQFDERVQSLVEHQVEGLSNPFSETSTAPGHVDRIRYGIWYGITHPWGAGLGATTLGAGKFGGEDLGTEGDISNLFVSLGILGGVLYGVFIFTALKTALDFWRVTRHWISLSILGILLVQILNWLNTSQYSTVMLIWFLLGAMETILMRLTAQVSSVRKSQQEQAGVAPEFDEARARHA